MIVVFATASGLRGGRLVQHSYSARIVGARGGHTLSAIQLTTAAGICTALDLWPRGRLPQKGFVGRAVPLAVWTTALAWPTLGRGGGGGLTRRCLRHLEQVSRWRRSPARSAPAWRAARAFGARASMASNGAVLAQRIFNPPLFEQRVVVELHHTLRRSATIWLRQRLSAMSSKAM